MSAEPEVYVVKPCVCPAPNPQCFRAGVPMVHRSWEICSGKCRSEYPCSGEMSARLRFEWDRKAVGLPMPPFPLTLIWGPEAERDLTPEEIAEMVGAHRLAMSGLKRPEPPTPGMKAAAKRFFAALWRWLKAGCPVPNPITLARRRAICRACPELDGKRCRKCGCFVAVKTAWRTEHCPIGKW